MMQKGIWIIVAVIILPVSALSFAFPENGLETHIGAGGSLYAPFHFRKFSFGYSISLTMRPVYAKYLCDELESWNLGMTVQSQVQYLTDRYSFKDVCFTLRYYFNRGDFGPEWQSGFVGAGVGVATVFWGNEKTSGKKKDVDFIVEAGYEVDLFNPLVLMFTVNYRVVDIEPVSYTGMGLYLNICYGLIE